MTITPLAWREDARKELIAAAREFAGAENVAVAQGAPRAVLNAIAAAARKVGVEAAPAGAGSAAKAVFADAREKADGKLFISKKAVRLALNEEQDGERRLVRLLKEIWPSEGDWDSLDASPEEGEEGENEGE